MTKVILVAAWLVGSMMIVQGGVNFIKYTQDSVKIALRVK